MELLDNEVGRLNVCLDWERCSKGMAAGTSRTIETLVHGDDYMPAGTAFDEFYEGGVEGKVQHQDTARQQQEVKHDTDVPKQERSEDNGRVEMEACAL